MKRLHITRCIYVVRDRGESDFGLESSLPTAQKEERQWGTRLLLSLSSVYAVQRQPSGCGRIDQVVSDTLQHFLLHTCPEPEISTELKMQDLNLELLRMYFKAFPQKPCRRSSLPGCKGSDRDRRTLPPLLLSMLKLSAVGLGRVNG